MPPTARTTIAQKCIFILADFNVFTLKSLWSAALVGLYLKLFMYIYVWNFELLSVANWCSGNYDTLFIWKCKNGTSIFCFVDEVLQIAKIVADTVWTRRHRFSVYLSVFGSVSESVNHLVETLNPIKRLKLWAPLKWPVLNIFIV